MRSFIRRAVLLPRVEPTAAPDGVEPQDPKVVARRLLVMNEGPRCAAWLVREHRRMIRTKGAYRFELWRRQQLPMWFSVAISFLRDRAGWEVEEAYERGGLLRVWILRWVSRGHFRSVVLGMRGAS